MTSVTISPKFQIVIPVDIREAMGLKPRQKVLVFGYEDRIEYVPLKKMREMRGFLKGMDTEIPREEDRV
jgi:AbrB family looped-hinge helix DNA binding protein